MCIRDRIAIERPTIAAAALDFGAWMEQRNAEKTTNEFDKYDLIFDVPSWVPVIGGQQASLNTATYMWFSDYPLESSMGRIVEDLGVGAVNKVSGTDIIHPSPISVSYTHL